jgi:hypothetical protein
MNLKKYGAGLFKDANYQYLICNSILVYREMAVLKLLTLGARRQICSTNGKSMDSRRDSAGLELTASEVLITYVMTLT